MKNRLVRFLTLTPAMALALIYGQTTGDVGSSHAVIALLLGMGIGFQFGRRPGAES